MTSPTDRSEPRLGLAAIAIGVSGFLYSVAFIIIARTNARTGAGLSGLFLVLGGVLTAFLLTGLYDRLATRGPGLARLAVVLGTVAALASAAHGSYDLANAINPPGGAVNSDLPSQVDPRGFFTFGVAGLAVLLVVGSLRLAPAFPTPLAVLGYLDAFLLILLYLGRLVILDAKAPLIAGAALLAGFVVNPAWYIWLGSWLRRAPAA